MTILLMKKEISTPKVFISQCVSIPEVSLSNKTLLVLHTYIQRQAFCKIWYVYVLIYHIHVKNPNIHVPLQCNLNYLLVSTNIVLFIFDHT